MKHTQPPAHPALASIVCSTRTAADGRLVSSFLADHNTPEGRAATAKAARAAMIAGHVFTTHRLTAFPGPVRIIPRNTAAE